MQPCSHRTRATAAFNTILTEALLTRQDRPHRISSPRQEFPRFRTLGTVSDAHLSRLCLRSALSRTGNRGRINTGGVSRSSPQAEAERLFHAAGAKGGVHAANSKAYDGLIREAARRHRVPEELVRAVVKVESNFNPRATSPKGAMGLMQLMPGTARDLGVQNAYNPQENINGGTRYLRQLMDRYHGSVPLALAAYNWGPGNLERGRSLPAETRNYLQHVRRLLSMSPAGRHLSMDVSAEKLSSPKTGAKG